MVSNVLASGGAGWKGATMATLAEKAVKGFIDTALF